MSHTWNRQGSHGAGLAATTWEKTVKESAKGTGKMQALLQNRV